MPREQEKSFAMQVFWFEESLFDERMLRRKGHTEFALAELLPFDCGIVGGDLKDEIK